MTIRTKRARSPRGSGDLLAEEIIAAATALILRESDPSAISIRSVAAKVGVSPPAIYLHFADKNELLDAVCARYFERLDDALAPAEECSEDALESFLVAGKAYVNFALTSPVLYRMAFSNVGNNGTWSRVDRVLASSAFVRFNRMVQKLAGEGYFVGDEAALAQLTMELWTTVHGVAHLMVSKPGLPWGDDADFVENVLRAGCIGFAASASVGTRASMPEIRAWLERSRSQ